MAPAWLTNLQPWACRRVTWHLVEQEFLLGPLEKQINCAKGKGATQPISQRPCLQFLQTSSLLLSPPNPFPAFPQGHFPNCVRRPPLQSPGERHQQRWPGTAGSIKVQRSCPGATCLPVRSWPASCSPCDTSAMLRKVLILPVLCALAVAFPTLPPGTCPISRLWGNSAKLTV